MESTLGLCGGGPETAMLGEAAINFDSELAVFESCNCYYPQNPGLPS